VFLRGASIASPFISSLPTETLSAPSTLRVRQISVLPAIFIRSTCSSSSPFPNSLTTRTIIFVTAGANECIAFSIRAKRDSVLPSLPTVQTLSVISVCCAKLHSSAMSMPISFSFILSLRVPWLTWKLTVCSLFWRGARRVCAPR